MKLIELREMAPRGTYYGVRPTKETIAAMREFMKEHHIPNPVEDNDLHATVVYSRAFCGARPLGELNPRWKAKFKAFDIFETGGPKLDEGSEEPHRCLVLKFHSPEIHTRHHDLRKNHGASHDFPTYEPHVTLSYNAGDFDHHNLPAFPGPHEFGEEYSEPLDSNWVK